MSAVVLKALWIYGLAAAVSALIAGVIKGMVWLLNRAEGWSAAARAPAAAAAPVKPVVPVSLALPADHIAVISAAVYASIGAHRIVQIDDKRGGAGWRAEGRIAQHRKLTPQYRGTKP